MPAPAVAPLCLSFRPQGVGRWAEASFLAVWLLSWVLGELFALAVLGQGLAAWLGLGARGSTAVTGGPQTLFVGAFLLVWLAFWTLGGVLAARQLLRLLWAVDRLVLEGTELVRNSRLGPLSWRRRFDARTIQRIYVREPGSGGGALVAQMPTGVVVLTTLGSQLQWVEAARQLSQALILPEGGTPWAAATAEGGPAQAEGAPAWAAGPPPGWEERSDPVGDRLLVPDQGIRRRQAWVMAGFTALAMAAAAALARSSLGNPGLRGVALIAAALAGLCVWGALWLAIGRVEWRLGPRQLVQQRRFGAGLRELWQARALELLETSDSDHDRWYDLRAIELSGDGPRQPPKALTITKVIHDPTVPRALGRWLARQTRMPFHDRVPSEEERRQARRRDLETLQEKLAASGITGRLSRSLLEGLMRRMVAEAQARQAGQRRRRRPSATGRSVREGDNAGGSAPRSPGDG